MFGIPEKRTEKARCNAQNARGWIGEKEMNKFYWSKYRNTGPKFNEIQEPSIVRCLLGAAGILALGVLSFVFIVLGLSL